MNTVRGLKQDAAWRIEEARIIAPFIDVNDLALRAQLDSADLKLLASASALATMTGNRREAMWVAAGSVPSKGLLREATIEEAALPLAPPTEAEDVLADYRHLGLTLGATR